MIIKEKFLQTGLFTGCIEVCYYCASQSNVCILMKKGIPCQMDDREILFEKILVEKTPSVESTSQDLNHEDVPSNFPDLTPKVHLFGFNLSLYNFRR